MDGTESFDCSEGDLLVEYMTLFIGRRATSAV